jgi:UDP-glucose 4-epimerase
MRSLQAADRKAIGLDLKPSRFTTTVGSIVDRAVVHRCMRGVRAVLHAATLHKPHIATHRRWDFIDTNVTGTLNVLRKPSMPGVEGRRLHEHDQRVRRGTGAGAWNAGRVDH